MERWESFRPPRLFKQVRLVGALYFWKFRPALTICMALAGFAILVAITGAR